MTFTAGSAVRALVAAVGGADALRGGTAARLDRPDDERGCARLGLEPDLEATEHTPDGLVAALLR